MKVTENPLQKLNKEEKRLFSIIQRHGPMAKNSIQLITDLKLSTLNRWMAPLLQEGLVVESKVGSSTGGRRPILYDVAKGRYYTVGIDLSRTHIKMVLADLSMNISESITHPMDESWSASHAIEWMIDIVKRWQKDMDPSNDTLLGIGIGAVGPLDRKKGEILNPLGFTSKGWHFVPIQHLMEKKTSMPVFLDNGANTAVLAEKLCGAGKERSNIAYIHCGMGIRTGVFASNTIVRTANDTEGAFGHMVIDMDGAACECGNYGCVECYVSMPGIVKAFGRAIKKGHESAILKKPHQLSYSDIANAAQSDDELAKHVITDAATVFGIALANYIGFLNPSLVILSGSMIYESDLFYRNAVKTAKKKVLLRGNYDVSFHKGGAYGEQAVALGASALVWNVLLNETMLGWMD